MANAKIRFGIRERLFLLILLAFGALIVTTFWQIGQQARQVSSATIEQSLERSSSVLDTKIESRFNSIREVAQSVARDGRILPLVYESEILTLQDQSFEFSKQLDFDVMIFTDEVGNIIARSDRPSAIGQNMRGRTTFFDAALSGQSGQGYFLTQDRLMQIVTEPIFDNVAKDVVRGTVALAYEFSSEMANEIVSLTFSDIAFFSFTRNQQRQVDGVNQIYVTNDTLGDALENYFSASGKNWEPLFSGDSIDQSFHTTLNNEEYFAVTKRIENPESEPLGFILILRSSTDLLAPFTSIQNTVLAIGAICLVIAFLLAAGVSFRISKPIIELASITRRIQEGDFPSKSNTSTASDEIGLLYRSVVEMGNTLKEKAELENYLAQLSTELNIDTALQQEALDQELTLDETLEKTLTFSHSNESMNKTSDTTLHTGAEFAEIVLIQDTVIANRYQVLRLIGRGAMGYVYLVHDRELDEKTALKLLPQQLFGANSALSIKDEIRLARRITHRNILRTFDMGNWNDFAYISMEYVQGYDLDILLKRRGALDQHIALLMARQICSAMNAAHDQGVIHLDLKPGNMMVNRQGILKIMDFGLAQSVISHQAQTDAKEQKMVMGTPRYMAPEQFLKDSLDQRTDVYSIGIILFTLLTGKPPFTHEDYLGLAELHVHQDLPAMQGVNGLITGPLDQIIRKASEKRPSDRYQTVREMLEQLNQIA